MIAVKFFTFQTEEESKPQLLPTPENPVNMSGVGNSVSAANIQTTQIHSTPTTCNNPFATFLHDDKNLSSILSSTFRTLCKETFKKKNRAFKFR